MPRAQSPGKGDGVEESKLAPAEVVGSGDKEVENILTVIASRCGESVEYFCGEKD